MGVKSTINTTSTEPAQWAREDSCTNQLPGSNNLLKMKTRSSTTPTWWEIKDLKKNFAMAALTTERNLF